MSTEVVTSPPQPIRADCGIRSNRQRLWVFVEWCLQREALDLWPYVALVSPLLVAGCLARLTLGKSFVVGQGPRLFAEVVAVAAAFIVIHGAGRASAAVVREASRDFRDLTRLTDFNPVALLWIRSLTRWVTVLFSVLLLFPLVMYARTLGGVTVAHWIAAGCWLVLFTVLISGIAMVASVRTGRANNTDPQAAAMTLSLTFLYHMIFWGLAALLMAFAMSLDYLGRQSNANELHAMAKSTVEFALAAAYVAPASGLYRALVYPDLFSPFSFSFGLHFVPAVGCYRFATRAIAERFRVRTRGDIDSANGLAAPVTEVLLVPRRPRCESRPFFWKDKYILGRGDNSIWYACSWLAWLGVLVMPSFSSDVIIAIGVIGLCLYPCILATGFDSLLNAELRDNMWTSLILLPCDPRIPIFAKLQATFSERKWLLFPVIVASGIAAYSAPRIIWMTGIIGFLSGALLIEISVLNLIHAKLWWRGLAFGIPLVGAIFGSSLVFIYYGQWIGFVVTLIALLTINSGLYQYASWRLRNWSDE